MSRKFKRGESVKRRATLKAKHQRRCERATARVEYRLAREAVDRLSADGGASTLEEIKKLWWMQRLLHSKGYKFTGSGSP